jgi:prepilin signal peptidase PulO-like enzyme (type II secretory pathway)
MLLRRARGRDVFDEAHSAAPLAEPSAAAPADGGTPAAVAPPAEDAETTSGPDDDVAADALAEGMGLGDVKMLGMVGAFLGVRMTLITVLLGSVAGCVIVLPWLAVTRRGWKTAIPFGPFLAAGAIIALFAGESLASAYARLLRRVFF